ncbi:MAG: tRNA uridine-5-carboxymethylaminomethyl(34) synthesis GTPase MnmE [Rhizobiales bacterium]|nr:tRNA uridine-5-carboxymethylaminomethyl(34) synthesis GTPase MnmE [Hyphomicrobiales bacterium]
MNQDSTIFALSSGSGRAGVAVVRVSGAEAGKVFALFGSTCPAPRKASLRRLFQPDGSVLDEVLALWLPGPGTATGEDMAELHLHGSPAIVSAVLAQLSQAEGFALAERGAFSYRAYRNRKLDLLQVEGLADVLEAETDNQRRLAMRQFLGDASHTYETWRADLVRALALMEAAIDFSEEDDVAVKATAEAQAVVRRLIAAFTDALSKAGRAAQVRRGLRVVLAGPPNAGKSSLLNWLVGRDTAIVSPVAGTTRDVVESSLVIAGTPILISDTAGLHQGTTDVIEQEGMRRTLRAVGEADILVWVEAVDGVSTEEPERKPDFRVLNKTDLAGAGSRPTGAEKVWPVSVRSGEGLDDFRAALEESIRVRNDLGEDAVVVRERHRRAVELALGHLHHARGEDGGGDGRGLEFIAEDMRKAAAALAGVTGRVDVEDLLGEIFSAFCIGK